MINEPLDVLAYSCKIPFYRLEESLSLVGKKAYFVTLWMRKNTTGEHLFPIIDENLN
jgi:hypothetical protein